MSFRVLVAHPRFPVGALAIAAFVLGAALIADPLTGHDEGQLMWGFSRLLWQAPLPAFFWQKAKPALAAVYLPTVGMGFGGYLLAHLAIAVLGLWALGETARALGHRRPWLAPLFVAASPLFAWCSVTGISSSDGVAGMALALYASEVMRRPLLAGALLGALPWIRFECAPFAGVLGIYLLARDRDPRLVLGAALWPVLYLGGGALYHHDAAWFLHFKPNISAVPADNEVIRAEFASHDFGTLAGGLALLSPALGAIVLFRPSRLAPLERVLAAYAVGFLALYAFAHLAPRAIGPAFALGYAPRYALMALPALAFPVGRAIEAIEEAPGHGLRDPLALLLLVALGVLARRAGGGTTVLWGAAALATAVSAVRWRRSGVAAAVLATLFVGGPLASARAFARDHRIREPWIRDATAAIASTPSERGALVITNSKLFPLYLARSERLGDRRVRLLLATDVVAEIDELTNHTNGQFEAVRRAAPEAIFGDTIDAAELRPERLVPGTLFLLKPDQRTARVLPPALWDPLLEPLGTFGEMKLWRLRAR